MSSKTNIPFEFAVGIECTFIIDEQLHAAQPMRRLEQFELMRHYEMWREDLDLVAKLNTGDRRVSKLRWCFPWYRIEATRGKFDFAWVDSFVDYANELNIELVPDIIHYGTPEWLENAFLHPDYTDRVAYFAGVCADRYKGRIKHYTPFNEPAIACTFSALRKEWPPYLSSQKDYVAVLIEIATGIQKTNKAIRAADAQAECWSVEVTNSYQALNDESKADAMAAARKDFLCWDLVHGLVDDSHEFFDWLIAQGAHKDRLQSLAANAVKMDVLGLNFYPWSVKTLERKERQLIQQDASGESDGMLLFDLLQTAYAHTGARMFVTETSAHGGGGSKSSAVTQNEKDTRIQWMDQTLLAVARARQEGIPVTGYTQYPLFTMVDWAYRLDDAPPTDYFLNLGMIEVSDVDWSRKWTSTADRFMFHMRNFEV